MKGNTVNKVIKGVEATVGIAAVTTVAAQAQNNAPNTNIRSMLESSVLKAYRPIDSIANMPYSNKVDVRAVFGNELRTIENFLGEQKGIYNLSTISLETMPNSGEGSIVYIGNEPWLRVIQVGSGYGKLATGEFKPESKISRDLSTTFASIANLLGLDDAKVREMVFYSNGIAQNEQFVVRNANGNVVDILYTGSAPRADVSKRAHYKMDGTIVQDSDKKKHILAVPGQSQLIPLAEVMELLGYEATPFVYFIKPAVVETPKKEEPKPEVKSEPKPETRDSVINRKGIVGTVTEKGSRIGLGVFKQIGNSSVDAELSLAGYLTGKDVPYNGVTEEIKEQNPLGYVGHSKLTDNGTYSFNDYVLKLVFTWHPENLKNLSLRGGLSADMLFQKYNGMSTSETWFERDGKDSEYDSHASDASFKKTDLRISPVIGAELNIPKAGKPSRVSIFADYHIPVIAPFNNKYVGDIDIGRFNMGLKFDMGKNFYHNKAPEKR